MKKCVVVTAFKVGPVMTCGPCVLPTCFGKSLCYACPPTVFGLVLPVEGTPLVFAVAPLTAIMKDQVSVASRRAYLQPHAQAMDNVAQ